MGAAAAAEKANAGRRLVDFVRVYDGSLEGEFCDQVVARFEADTAAQKEIEVTGIRRFTALTLSQAPNWADVHSLLLARFFGALKTYVQDTGVRWLPGNLAYEVFRIKRYLPGGDDWFGPHVDVSDAVRARRCLVALWYLNDVVEGGETEFVSLDLSVKAKKGRLLMFPPNFLYPHAGHPPISGAKYIVSSYFLYA